MNKGKRRIDRMNSFVVGIDPGEKESDACYMSPDGEIKEGFKFPMNKEGYTEFRKKIPVETGIAFEASGSAYAVSSALKDLGYNDITVAHPKELSWITKSKKKIRFNNQKDLVLKTMIERLEFFENQIIQLPTQFVEFGISLNTLHRIPPWNYASFSAEETDQIAGPLLPHVSMRSPLLSPAPTSLPAFPGISFCL